MNNLNIETHFLKNNEHLSSRLVRDLQINIGSGKTVVLTTSPHKLMKLVSHEWMKATTSIPSLRFSEAPFQDIPEADVTFCKVEDLLNKPPLCGVMFITHPVEKEKLYLITSWMPPGTLVIQYALPTEFKL